jgi:hypothetical protein
MDHPLGFHGLTRPSIIEMSTEFGFVLPKWRRRRAETPLIVFVGLASGLAAQKVEKILE